MSGAAGSGARALVEVEDLEVVFSSGSSRVQAVQGLSFHIARGETLAIVGESGSGKSVSASAIMGVLPPNAEVRGLVRVDGVEVLGLDERQLLPYRAGTAAMIFQDPVAALSPYYTIGRQLEDRIAIVSPSLNRKARRQRAIELLRTVQMPHPELKADAYPFQVSGGQAQRVVIAMALAGEPALLIADEPTTALDVTVQAEILDLLRGLATEFDAALLLITHDMGVVADLADRVLVMRQGRAVETGTTRSLFSWPTEAYTRELLSAVPRLGSQHRVAATPTGNVLLRVSDLRVSYARGRARKTAPPVLRDLDLELHRGETMGVVGESGSGKSTLGQAILGFAPVVGGSIEFDGRSLAGLGRRARKNVLRSMGVIFQNPGDSLDPRFTVFDAVAEPMRVAGHMSPAHIRDRVGELLDRVGLPGDWSGTYQHEISGGQRQRVSIARALALEPELVIADEPTSALDVSVQRRVLQLFADLQEEMGFACLFISHDLAVVEQVCDTVLVLDQGGVRETSSIERILNNPQSEYTRDLVAASPVPDPDLQRERRLRMRAAKEQ